MSSLLILAGSVFEISCGKQTDRQTDRQMESKSLPLQLLLEWVNKKFQSQWKRGRIYNYVRKSNGTTTRHKAQKLQGACKNKCIETIWYYQKNIQSPTNVVADVWAMPPDHQLQVLVTMVTCLTYWHYVSILQLLAVANIYFAWQHNTRITTKHQVKKCAKTVCIQWDSNEGTEWFGTRSCIQHESMQQMSV